MPHPWRHLRPGWMWLWAAWSKWLATAHSRVLNNWIIIVVLFNPGYSMILWFYDCISMEVIDIEHVFLSAMLIFLWHD